MARTRYYFYSKIDKIIVRAKVSDNLIEQYEFKILTGLDKGKIGYSSSFRSLLIDDNYVFR